MKLKNTLLALSLLASATTFAQESSTTETTSTDSRKFGIGLGFGNYAPEVNFIYSVNPYLELGTSANFHSDDIAGSQYNSANIHGGATFILPHSKQLDFRLLGIFPGYGWFKVDGASVNSFSLNMPILNVGLKWESIELVVGPRVQMTRMDHHTAWSATALTGEFRLRF